MTKRDELTQRAHTMVNEASNGTLEIVIKLLQSNKDFENTYKNNQISMDV